MEGRAMTDRKRRKKAREVWLHQVGPRGYWYCYADAAGKCHCIFKSRRRLLFREVRPRRKGRAK